MHVAKRLALTCLEMAVAYIKAFGFQYSASDHTTATGSKEEADARAARPAHWLLHTGRVVESGLDDGLDMSLVRAAMRQSGVHPLESLSTDRRHEAGQSCNKHVESSMTLGATNHQARAVRPKASQ